MIIARIRPDLDIKVTSSSVAFLVFRLFSEVPVRHIGPTSGCEEFFHVIKDLDPLFASLEVVEGSKEDNGIPHSATREDEAIHALFSGNWIASSFAMTEQ